MHTQIQIHLFQVSFHKIPSGLCEAELFSFSDASD